MGAMLTLIGAVIALAWLVVHSKPPTMSGRAGRRERRIEFMGLSLIGVVTVLALLFLALVGERVGG